MSGKIKFGITIGLGALFVGVIVVYSFIQPFQQGMVCNAIPQQASFVFTANTLEELLQSPVCNQLDKALGAGNSLAESTASNDWKKLAAASEIAVADIPYRNMGEQKSWAAVSWVGWRSPWLRWKLEAAAGKQLTFLGKHAVWPIWEYTSPDLAHGMHLTFSLTDNLFIACLSESPSDIVLLLDTYDGRVASYSRGK
ncbi:hypothetical protein P4C99_18490 [Pontiellaceae bacterium B1224]|nr:hypothetical protein [Pontiellaceae bacterium B1224]